MFIVCAVLGFIPAPQGGVRIVLTLLSAAFFIPPAVLTYDAARAGDRATLALIRSLSVASLGMTVLVLICNFLSVLGSEALGDLLYRMLIVVSSPMVCSGSWGLSLFLWACLLIVTSQQLKRP